MEWKWDDLKLFLAVYDQGSLSGAARLLKLGQPTLSRRMGELEALVGAPLLIRQPQGISLTEAGQRLLPSAQRMAEWAHEAQLNLTNPKITPSGKVRIAAVPSVAYIMAPFSAMLRKKYPELQLEVHSTVEGRNLSRGEADLALRLTCPSDSDLQCIDHFSVPLRVHASPEYASTLPLNFKLTDIDWICWAPPYDNQPINQMLKNLMIDFNPAFVSDDFLVQVSACAAGVGAMVMPKYPPGYGYTHEWVELDIDLGPDALTTLYLVCHKRHRKLQRVELVINCICEEFNNLREGNKPGFSTPRPM